MCFLPSIPTDSRLDLKPASSGGMHAWHCRTAQKFVIGRPQAPLGNDNLYAVKPLVNICLYPKASAALGFGQSMQGSKWGLKVLRSDCVVLDPRWDISRCHPQRGPGNIAEEEVKYYGAREWRRVRWVPSSGYSTAMAARNKCGCEFRSWRRQDKA